MNVHDDGDRQLHNEWSRRLEQLGVENVRIHLIANIYIPEIDREYAQKWLSQKDEQQRATRRRIAICVLAASGAAVLTGIAAVFVKFGR
jgi:hypothetical protein